MPDSSHKPLDLLPGPAPEARDGSVHPEKRTSERYPFTAAADVFDIHSQTRIIGRTSDIGLSGCYVDTLSPLGAGAVVRVRLEHELQQFEAIGVVVYANIPMGMGIGFSDIKTEHQTVLKNWIARLSGEPSLGTGPGAAGPESGVLAALENLRLVMKEIIYMMIRKKIISENEGAGLMRQMFR